MKKAIITHSPQDSFYTEAFEKVIVPRLEYLSKKYEAELIISNSINPEIKKEQVTNPEFYTRYLKYNKCFILKNLIKQFDRSLYIDPFTVISKKMPNIFDLFIQDNFYAVLDAPPFDKLCEARIEEMIASQAILGSLSWYHTYYNTSFMLLNSNHYKLFEDSEYKMPFKCFDQTKINYYLNKYKFPHVNLPREFNSNMFNNSDTSLSINGLCPPEILAKNCYIVNTDHVPNDFKNDYIFKLDILLD